MKVKNGSSLLLTMIMLSFDPASEFFFVTSLLPSCGCILAYCFFSLCVMFEVSRIFSDKNFMRHSSKMQGVSHGQICHCTEMKAANPSSAIPAISLGFTIFGEISAYVAVL